MLKRLKRDKIYYLWILLTVIVFCIPYLNNDIAVIPSQDLTFHLNRLAGLANAFEEGQILPKIYPYANFGFGYATPLFYCDFFLYPFAILYHFGLSAISCFKIAIFAYTLIGTVLMFYICQKIFNNYKASFLATMIYLFANYHLQNIFVRAALGEVLAMTFIPLAFYAFYKLLILHEDAFILLGVSFTFLIMSHLISTLLMGILFSLFIIMAIIFNRHDLSIIKKMLISILKGTLLAALLSLWYLLPMLEQMLDQTFWLSINKNYNNIASTMQSPLDILKPLALMSLSGFDIVKDANIGIFTLLLILPYSFLRKNKYINVLLITVFIIYLLIIGIIPTIPLLEIIQFNFRFYLLLYPLGAFIIAYNFKEWGRDKLTIIISLCFLGFSIFNIVHLNNELKTGDYFLLNNAALEDINNIEASEDDGLDYDRDELGGAEYLPYTVNMNYKTENNSIKTIDHNGNKVDYDWDYERNFTTIIYQYADDEKRELLFPLSYYKGYKAYELIEGKKVNIPIYNYDLYKLVSINAEAGKHIYMITYEGTLIQKLSLSISALTVIILLGYIIYERHKQWKKLQY